MSDIRDGERLPNIRGKEVYRQPDGSLALWDGERHVIIGSNREGLRVALQQMKAAREYAEAKLLVGDMVHAGIAIQRTRPEGTTERIAPWDVFLALRNKPPR